MKHVCMIFAFLLILCVALPPAGAEQTTVRPSGAGLYSQPPVDHAPYPEYALDSGWVLTWHPDACIGNSGDSPLLKQPGAEEIAALVRWLHENLESLISEAVPDTAFFDPAVYQTALPAPYAAIDPAVYQTAMPAPVEVFNPAVYQTAMPAPTAAPTAASTFATKAPTAQRSVPQPTVRPTALPTVSTGDYTTITASAQEQKLLNLLNADRARNNLPPLVLDPGLSQLARMKSQDFDDNDYFDHESPVYGNAAQMLDAFQYDYRGVGENIAHYGSVEKAEAAFMSSDGHRRNILGSQWDKVGIGVAYDENGFLYVTQLFAR